MISILFTTYYLLQSKYLGLYCKPCEGEGWYYHCVNESGPSSYYCKKEEEYKEQINYYITNIKTFVIEQIKPISELLKIIGKGVYMIFDELYNIFTDTFTFFNEYIFNTLSIIIEKLELLDTWKTIKNISENVLKIPQTILKSVEILLNNLTKSIEQFFIKLRNLTEYIANKIGLIIKKIPKILKDIIIVLRDGIVVKLRDDIKKAVKSIPFSEGIIKMFEELAKGVISIINTIITSIDNLEKNITNVFKNIEDNISSVLNVNIINQLYHNSFDLIINPIKNITNNIGLEIKQNIIIKIDAVINSDVIKIIINNFKFIKDKSLKSFNNLYLLYKNLEVLSINIVSNILDLKDDIDKFTQKILNDIEDFYKGVSQKGNTIDDFSKVLKYNMLGSTKGDYIYYGIIGGTTLTGFISWILLKEILS
jgi:hypothetical protein